MTHLAQRRQILLVMTAIFALNGSNALGADKVFELIVPAYFYPAGAGATAWKELDTAAKKVKIHAILNPASGPGKEVDTTYVAVIGELRKAGGKVYGYIPTTYGKRPTAEVMADVAAYIRFYQIDGIFLDEMGNLPSQLEYYRDITRHIHQTLPGSRVFANSGSEVPESFIRQNTADVIVTFENTEQVYLAARTPSWTMRYPPERFGNIVHTLSGEQALKKAIERARASRVGYVFFTDAVMPNPYDRLPSFWDKEVNALK
jgi:hypothetical protein